LPFNVLELAKVGTSEIWNMIRTRVNGR
jgi:hypothetical protein